MKKFNFTEEMISRVMEVIDDYDLNEYSDSTVFRDALEMNDITGNYSGTSGLDNPKQACLDNLPDIVQFFKNLDSLESFAKYLVNEDYDSMAIWALENALDEAVEICLEGVGKTLD